MTVRSVALTWSEEEAAAMDSARVVEIVLVSVLLGALLPVLVQLWLTLRTVQRRLDRTADRLDRALEGLGVAAERLNRATQPLDDGRRVRELMDAVDGLARTVNELRSSAKVASAVGAAVVPAIAAAVRALRGPEEPEGESKAEAQDRTVRSAPEAA
jgi:hypothetical protein